MTEENAHEGEEFKYIVRLADTDIDGEKGIGVALQGVKGVGKRVAEIVVKKAQVDSGQKIGYLPDDKLEVLENLIQNYGEVAPPWALNRQNDYESGDDLHIVGGDLEMVRKDDINRLKMIRSYRGIRHESGQKVRGQRTRANGRTGLTLGVSRSREGKAK
ncbi:MAG: 30S ribosomal protein S13 [Methanomassiliicoccales archaeon]